MKLYTKTGDLGTTSLIGERISKDDLRVDTYGTLDELNSYIGFIRSLLDIEVFKEVDIQLQKIQMILFEFGSSIASNNRFEISTNMLKSVRELEEHIDNYTEQCEVLNQFILPGGSKEAATIHIARTTARKCERLIVQLNLRDKNVNADILVYMNRLSDFFFVLARYVNHEKGIKDVKYVFPQ